MDASNASDGGRGSFTNIIPTTCGADALSWRKKGLNKTDDAKLRAFSTWDNQ